MKFAASNWAYAQPKLTPAEKAVLVALAFRANDKNECWPGQKTLAQMTSLSRETVSRAITKLAMRNLVQIVQKTEWPKPRSTNRYRLLVEGVISGHAVTEDQIACDHASTCNVTHDQTNLHSESSMNDHNPPTSLKGGTGDGQTAYAYRNPDKNRKRERFDPDSDSEFTKIWDIYPPRLGENNKRTAYRAYRATLRRGVKPQELFDAVDRYLRWTLVNQKIGGQHVMMAATFFGPDERWRAKWDYDQALLNGVKRIGRTGYSKIDAHLEALEAQARGIISDCLKHFSASADSDGPRIPEEERINRRKRELAEQVAQIERGAA